MIPNPLFSLTRLARVSGALLLSLVFGPLQAQSLSPTINTGEDWSFPATASVAPAQYSGLFIMDGSTSGLIKSTGITLWWAMLNPNENGYDFTPITNALAAAPTGTMVAFRMKASVYEAIPNEKNNMLRAVPDWVVTKYNLNPQFVFNTASDKKYIAPWHPGVQAEFRKFLLEMGRRGILENPKFMAIYLHGMSHSAGEEMGIEDSFFTTGSPAPISVARQTAIDSGFSNAGGTALEDAIMDCWKKRMAWWREAAGPDYVGKVVWMGAGKIDGTTSAYSASTLDTYAISQGLGRRHGLLEHYYYRPVHPDSIGVGQSFVSNYVESKWNATDAPLRNDRYWGDENEETNRYNSHGFSGNAATRERDLAYRSSFFRAAQLGMRFLWTETVPINYASNQNPTGASGVSSYAPTGSASVPQWFSLVAGKGPAESPDAAAWLREANVRLIPGAPSPSPWKNMERLLMQRDISGAQSQTAEIYNMPYVGLKVDSTTDPTVYAEATARRTNAPTSRKLAFKLDTDFRTSLTSQDVQIRVTYLDNSSAAWQVDVARGGGSALTIGSITQSNPGTPTWKTAIFTLDAANLPFNPDAAGMDFYIHVPSGSANVIVRYVRVVRTQPAAVAPVIVAQPRSQDVMIGVPVTLSVVPKGTGPFIYQWYKNQNGVTGLISGATNQILTLSSPDAGTAGSYTVEAKDINNVTVISVPAQIQVVDAGLLIDDFDDGETSVAPKWIPQAGFVADNPTIGASNASPVSPDGSYYMTVTFNTTNTWKYATLDTGVFGARWQARGATGLRLYLKGNASYTTLPNGKIKLQLREGLNGERWSYDISPNVRNGSWQQITVPWGSFTADGGTTIVNAGTLDVNLIDQIRFYENGSHTTNVTAAIDRIEVVGYSKTIDNFNDGEALVPYWRSFAAAASDYPVLTASNSGTLSGDGSYYANIAYNSSAVYEYALIEAGSEAFGSSWTVNGANALQFYIRGSTSLSSMADGQFKVQIREGETGERWSFNLGNIVKASNGWQLVTIPLDSTYFTADGGTASGTTGALDLPLIDQIRFYNNSYGTSFTVAIDGLRVLQQ